MTTTSYPSSVLTSAERPTDRRSGRPVSVEELRRAWYALQDGRFRGRPDGSPGPAGRGPVVAEHQPASSSLSLSSPRSSEERRSLRSAPVEWSPAEAVLPVVGCLGQAGASTLALALATAAAGDGIPARVIECSSATATGLAGAATAELGLTGQGWAAGRRGSVLIARCAQVYCGPDELPAPDRLGGASDDGTSGDASAVGVTVLDVGWELGLVWASDSWVRDTVTEAEGVVAVTAATVPGMRRLETALTLLGPSRVLVAVAGPVRRRWPRLLVAARGPHTRAADDNGALITLPFDKHLALRGVDSTPLPVSLLTAADTLLRHPAAGARFLKGPLP